jgi:hypothetical protein
MFRSIGRACAFAAALAFLGVVPPAEAGIRTRSLPPVPDRVESALVARAVAATAPRIHCLVEIEPGMGARAFADEDVRLLRPAGGRRWLASVPVTAIRERALARGVVVAWDLGPSDRCPPGFVASFGAIGPDEPVSLRIKVFADASLEDVTASIVVAGGRVALSARTLGFVDASVPRAFLETALANDDVRWIERAPDEPVLANDNMRVDADVNSVQGIGLDGAGVLIGMWDGGRPDPTHPDLVGRITLGEPGLIAQPHPTHVAGTLLGSGANSVNQGGSSLQWRGVATAAEAVCYEPSGAALEVEDAILTYDIDLTTNSWVYPISESNGNCAL